MKRRTFALALGSVVAGLTTGSPSLAEDQSKTKKSKAAKHDCKGRNTCKGQGGCKTGDNGCAGRNSCKGKGGCAVGSKNKPGQEGGVETDMAKKKK